MEEQLDFFAKSSIDSSRISYAQLFVEFYQDVYSRNNHKPKTQEVHRTSSKHLIPYFGKIPISSVTPHLIQLYISNRKKEGAADRTINIELTCLRAHLHQAELMDWLDKNPFRKVRLLPEKAPRVRDCSDEEYEAIWQSAAPLLQMLMVLGVASGMRRKEMATLRWPKIDLDRSLFILEDTKTGKVRSVGMNQTAREVILSQPRYLKIVYVFVNPKTLKPYNPNWFTTLFIRARRKAGVGDHVTFNSLRHTCATRLLRKRRNLKEIGVQLGHVDTRMTNRYAHLYDEHQVEIAKDLDDTFKKDKQNSGVCAAPTP